MATPTVQLDVNNKPLNTTLMLEPVCNGGWVVSVRGEIGSMNQPVAAMSDSNKLLEWLQTTLYPIQHLVEDRD